MALSMAVIAFRGKDKRSTEPCLRFARALQLDFFPLLVQPATGERYVSPLPSYQHFSAMGSDPIETRNPAALAADPPLADCYLVGSDQVFHLHFLKDAFKSRHALLNFGADSVRRVVYAASFGCPVWTDEVIANHQWGVPLLKRFSAIGLRETTGVELLRKWSGIQGLWTPDPTLLLDANAYCRQFKVERVQKARRQVVSYMLGFANEPQRRSLHARC